MNTENESDQEEPEERKGFLRQLLSKVPFGRPETTQDLENEILELLEEGEEHGLISSLEEKMINSIFDFRDTLAAEIMTPAAEVVSIEASMPMADIINLVIENGFTRIPVYQDNPDRVVGVLHAKDLLRVCAHLSNKPVVLDDVLRPIYFVTENKPIVDLLKEFQMRKNHMAMVTDEFGTVRGLITLEDILEEIVGEIDDEYDEEQDVIERLEDGAIVVHARLDIEKIEEFFDAELPEGPFESVGGLVIHLLGRLGKTGDVMTVGGLKLEVKSASSRHIKMVRIERIPDGDKDE
ncbi:MULTISPECIES: hemolysin family protein [Desulfosediminicola]|uniref:hemolysin family protein n=1 Tax=Desulfosediminicola TaxID=2886823 RepID=UPI0010AC5324|nr:hemolysin family protein [Desulfosediminicola ganghwensis]